MPHWPVDVGGDDRFAWDLRVRYHETDPQQFVFNSRYLEYADTAMTEYFRHLGWSYPTLLQQGFDPSVVTTTVTFRSPARLDDQLTAHVRCARVGRSSFELDIEIRRAATRLAQITSTYVNVDPAGRATPIPGVIADALRADLQRTASVTDASVSRDRPEHAVE